MKRNYRHRLKNWLDRLISAVGLIFLTPLFIIISFAIAITMGFPIFFRQNRPGLNNKIFKMYKFRTMRRLLTGEDPYYSDTQRLSKLGVFLKKYSLDELPELFNVLRGEMSLVGPRPLLPEYLALYTPEQLRRHEVRPGITGLAQVKGRTGITLSKRFEMDIWYVDNWSIGLDLKILFMTAVQVIRPEDSVVIQDHAAIDDLGFIKNSTLIHKKSSQGKT